jgi:hypothetical protein
MKSKPDWIPGEPWLKEQLRQRKADEKETREWWKRVKRKPPVLNREAWAVRWQGQSEYLPGLSFAELCHAAADAIQTDFGRRPTEWAAAWLAVRWCESGKVVLLEPGHDAHDYDGSKGYVPRGFTGVVVKAPAPDYFQKVRARA